ncbi:MAG: hypothetical protein KatS3mg124_0627 [Porticoccaceae bacterium]|nr:MAG: hypothetical protein KatS3mg124_0627 [Porticoccaceae bacterium]
MADGRALVDAFFAALPAGQLPEELLHHDFAAWTTLQGPLSKDAYRAAVAWLARLFSPPIRFAIHALSGEGERLVAQVHSQGWLVDGSDYANHYTFAFQIREGRIAGVEEHFDPQPVRERLLPLMARLAGQD